MKTMKLTPIALFILLFSAAYGQNIEYGGPEELAGVKSYFIDTGTNLEYRNKIKDYISKKLPDLTLADNAESAEVVLIFKTQTKTGSYQKTYLDIYSGTLKEAPATYSYEAGEGAVVKIIKGPEQENRIRVLMNYQPKKRKPHPVIKFTQQFVKAYKENQPTPPSAKGQQEHDP